MDGATMKEEEDEAAAAAVLSALPINDDDDPKQQEETSRIRRSICYDGCGRPSTVCICPYLPTHPIPTSTEIILLHHPHSLNPSSTNTLSTLPPLSSLLHLHLLRGRRLRLGSHPLLDSLFHHHSSRPALFLFPSLPSSPSPLPLSRWAHQTPPPTRASPVLIAFDGTWAQSKEMAAASLPFLLKFATHVSLGFDERAQGPSSYESELVVRKEPFAGCVSTMEAVARALRVMEPDEEVGVMVEETLVGVLRAMVVFQARHLKPVKPRIKMRKKKKEMRKEEGRDPDSSEGV